MLMKTFVVLILVGLSTTSGGLLKGVGSVSESYGRCNEIVQLNISWWYNWQPFQSPSCNTGLDFVPMIWGSTFVKDVAIVNKSAPALLGFNEPDDEGQSNMTPEEAAGYWPKLEETGMRLGSPAVSAGANAYQWLDKFFSLCINCRVDFVAVHWYSPWTGKCNSEDLINHINFFANRYRKPVWLTEFDCADGNYNTNLQFMKDTLPLLAASCPSLERFGWFTTRPYDNIKGYYQGMALFDDNGVKTNLGTYYSSFPVNT